MRKLHVQSCGEPGDGPDLVVLHGWGMHSGIWKALAGRLQNRYRLHCVDLPGHGKSPFRPELASLTAMASAVHECIDERIDGVAHLLGWSLGGMVAVQLAAGFARQVTSLSLIATNLSFTRRDDWPDAVAENVLADFARQLMLDSPDTLQRFLGLQVYGQPKAKETLRQLREQIMAEAPPSDAALRAGLAILQTADLRSLASQIRQPVLLIGGDKDRLVPPAALEKMQGLFAKAQTHMIENSGHAPFIVQPDFCAGHIMNFIDHVQTA